MDRGLDQIQKLTDELLGTFGNKYVNSSKNKELLSEFLVKYEDEALKYKNRRDIRLRILVLKRLKFAFFSYIQTELVLEIV